LNAVINVSADRLQQQTLFGQHLAKISLKRACHTGFQQLCHALINVIVHHLQQQPVFICL